MDTIVLNTEELISVSKVKISRQALRSPLLVE